MGTNEEIKKYNVGMSAIDQYVQTNIVSAREDKAFGRDWIMWGDKNQYPHYLRSLKKDCTTLKSVINGFVDYIVGNDVKAVRGLMPDGTFNRKGQKAIDIVRETAENLAIFDGAAWEIIANRGGDVAEIYVLPMENIRSNKDNNVFYYSEDFEKGGRMKILTIPKFMKGEAQDHAILYVKKSFGSTYPESLVPTMACETERSIDEFHLNSISNGFMGSYLFNFCNGIPEDTEKDEIEKNLIEKFAGSKNAGRFVINFADGKDRMATLQKLEIADYGEKYKTLSDHCRQQIFTAYRTNPNLFGIPTASGFNSEEYESAFKLFNRTMVKPCQGIILDMFEAVMGESGLITIDPFSMEGEVEKDVK